ncbi:MAG: undecaprenyl/decaprenyl-phosphate alpha-N-acetylglucosaminyl 1-phosphate transferase [Candidatus Edwardsbacteria bacterium]|nr:undecaprenyl/decaprenyl-phosphate alpha-N-acetylglucosaminyl 1-phosphate transferase [Candidatus Edwardsbacteria bacterium]MBU1575729.1 undecaprenyl/decaprenyl-phosphate alpha-N-acetylglucosaminyl 1-phosphate transferase [Candidatus Edwardsbacteria bacterium]MBU2464665.1 undecaprenyl/decaprenyl-phosphate alpha-N-acetylglucosaminyl 1-phosphate transferase [Candidatus Edwardsbacteria bacterium]MBU2594221.1 undecaprenyl/decaprenyl-phosphate alpha-N-acetylglucosaminyl 1-phosphate transferase [Can
MLNYLIVLITALVATLLFLPLAMIMGRRMGIWDHPDELGMHHNSTPRSGGIAMVFGIWVALEVCWMLPQLEMGGRQLAAMGIGSLGLFVIGLLDDLSEIKPHVKAIGLAAAGLAIMLVSRHINLTGYERLDFVLGIFVLIAGANALNFLDGLDGLASGLTAIASLGFLGLGLLAGDVVLACWAAILAGVALGFCSRNFPPASIFMGDSGSLVLGGILGWMFLLLGSHGPSYLAAAFILLSWLIIDTGLAIIRRAFLHHDIFTGDRRHVYDMMYQKYHSAWKVNGIMYSIQVILVMLALSTRGVSLWIPLALAAALWLAIIGWMIKLGMFAPPDPGEQGRPALPEVEDMDLDKGMDG